MDVQNSDLLDLIPAYALNALSPEEKAQVESFIATSEAAQKELETYQAMLTGYALATPARKAPARLNEDFRARLAAEATGKPVLQSRRGNSRVRAILALAAVLIVAVGVTFLLRYINDPERPIREIIDNPAAQWITLDAQANNPGKVSVVMLPDHLQAVIVADLPTLPQDKQYQVWWIGANKPPSSMLVFSAAQGTTRVLMNMPKWPTKDTLCGITVEPSGGSPSPTTQPIIAGALVKDS